MTEHIAVGGSFGGLHIIIASFPDFGSTKAVQVTNAAVRAKLFYSRSRDEHCSFSAELCYISLASPALSLQATSTHISSLHEHVAAPKTPKIHVTLDHICLFDNFGPDPQKKGFADPSLNPWACRSAEV